MQATVDRPMDKFLGKPRTRGEVIDADELAKVSPQMLRSLVDSGYLRVDGMVAGPGSSVEHHLRARVDNLEDRVKRLEAANADLVARLERFGAPPSKRPVGRPRTKTTEG